MEEKRMKIKYSRWGLANKIKDTIVLNKHLKKYPWLHARILKHELKHNEDMLFNVKHDYKDLFSTGLKEWISKIGFMVKHPGALLQLSPVWYYEGRTYLDLSLVLMYLVIWIVLKFLLE